MSKSCSVEQKGATNLQKEKQPTVKHGESGDSN
jgi:hypothetical protein